MFECFNKQISCPFEHPVVPDGPSICGLRFLDKQTRKLSYRRIRASSGSRRQHQSIPSEFWIEHHLDNAVSSSLSAALKTARIRRTQRETYSAPSMHRKDPNSKPTRSEGKNSPVRRAGVLRCSTCGEPFRVDETPTPPFCSERCQLVDMGRWLDEEISVPHEGGNSDVMGRQNDPFHFDDDQDDNGPQPDDQTD